jgi:hypothetical protein
MELIYKHTKSDNTGPEDDDLWCAKPWLRRHLGIRRFSRISDRTIELYKTGTDLSDGGIDNFTEIFCYEGTYYVVEFSHTSESVFTATPGEAKTLIDEAFKDLKLG